MVVALRDVLFDCEVENEGVWEVSGKIKLFTGVYITRTEDTDKYNYCLNGE